MKFIFSDVTDEGIAKFFGNISAYSNENSSESKSLAADSINPVFIEKILLTLQLAVMLILSIDLNICDLKHSFAKFNISNERLTHTPIGTFERGILQ